jgi:hypothetical protein
METHANHLHPTPGKKWSHYFFEFFMLFLAVFCGFLAENFREHQLENRREYQFIRSMIDDVKLDTMALRGILTRRLRRKEMFDSLSLLLNSSQRDNYVSRLYFFSRHIQRLSPVIFTYNDRTIQQLKNGGNMRVIRNNTDDITIFSVARITRKETLYILSLPQVWRDFAT